LESVTVSRIMTCFCTSTPKTKN